MAVTSTAIFVQAPRVAVAQATTANTNRDGSGSLATVFTAGANGSRIEHIDITATGNTTAGVIRLYISDGTNHRLWKEILVGAITVSATVAAFMQSIDCSKPENALFLQTGYSLRASTHNTETFNIAAVGGDF